MSRESTLEYYRKKAKEEREGKENKSNKTQSTTSGSTLEYYRKKAQEEREAQQPDTNKVSGGATVSKPVVDNSTSNSNATTKKPALPTRPSVDNTTTKPQEPAQNNRNSAAVKYEMDALSKQRTELERERAALLSNRKTAVSPRVQELGDQIKEIRGQLDTLSAEFGQLEKAEKQALIDSGEYRDASFLDYTWNALKQGWYNSMYGAESFHEMMGADNEKQKYEDILAGEDYKFIPSNGFEEAISGAANLLGQQARQWTHPRSLAAGGAAAAATAIAGQVGPQVLAPEEIITVPAAFMAGIAAGSTTSNFEIEAGFAYNEMLEQGISPETARKVAIAVGGANAALEMVQADELIKSFKVLKGAKATQGVAGRIAQELLDRGIDVAKETAQEVAQEGATIAGTQIGSKIDKGEWAYSAGDVVDRLGDTAKSSALSFGVMNVPGGTYNTYNILRDQQNQQNQQAQQTAPIQQEAQVQGDPEAVIEEAALEIANREAAERAATEAEIAPQESVSREDVSEPNRGENVAPSSNLEAAAMEMAQEEMRKVQRTESLLNNPGYGERGTSAFREIVEESGRDPGEVRREFQTAYEAGRTGLSREHITVLNPVQATAFNAGQQDLIADQARDKADQAKGVEVSGKAGFDSTGVPKDVTKAEVEVLDKLFKMVGVHGHMAGNQSYNAKLTGTTDVAIANDFQREVYDSKGNVVRTFTIVDHGVHEAGLHQAMKLAPVQMRAFINDFYNYLGKDNVPTMGTLAQRKQESYGAQDVSLTLDKATEEVTANEVFATLYGSNVEQLNAAMDRVMNGKNEDAKKGARTFLDVLSDLWKKVKAIAAQLRGKGDVKTAREVEQTADAIKELRDKYEAALKVAVENAAKAEKNTAQQDGDMKKAGSLMYSMKLSFEDQVDAALNRELDRNTAVYVMDTPEMLQAFGLKDYPMLMTQKHLRDINHEKSPNNSNYHGIPEETIKHLPDMIKEPVMVMESATHPGEIVVVTSELDPDGLPIIVAIKPDGSGQFNRAEIASNFVKSVYGKGGFGNFVDAAIKQDRVLYNNKKRTRALFSKVRLQLPEFLNRDGFFKDTIAQQEGNVKSEAEELSDRDTQFSLREKDPPKKVGIAYKVFYAKDGQLYPPMVANPGGAGTPVGVWLDADVAASAAPSKTGRPQVQAGGKGTNASKMSLAFRPGWHLGDLPMATQFARKNPETGVKDLFPADFVWAECEYAMDHDYQEEAMSYGYTENGKFRHSYAGLPKLPEDGYYRYRTNPNPDTVPWVITGAMRVKRILTDAETDKILRDAGVEPMKRQGGELNLEKLGLKAGEQYSLKDSDGRTLTEQQREYFKDSKVRDEKGNLKVMYHGTENAGFHVFNPKMSDDGISLFFVDRNEVAASYSGSAEVYEAKTFKTTKEMNKFFAEIGAEDYGVYRSGSRFALTYEDDTLITRDTLGEIYEDFCAYAGVGEGSANYKVYLNLTNPLVVDADGRRWDSLTGWSKVANLKEDEVTVKRVGDEFRLYKNEQEIKEASIAVNRYNQDIDTEVLKSIMVNKVNSILAITTENKTKTRDVAQYAKEQGYDGVIFKNIVDIGAHGSKTQVATVAIAFNSEQVKSVDNTEPTEDPDIRFSLKEEGGIQTATNKAGDVVAETHEDGSTMFSLKTYEADGRAYLRNWLDKKVKSKAITREEADDITRQMDEFYDICQKFTDKYAPFGAWSEAEVVKGKDGKPAFSVVKANGDYAMNLDFSLVCKKRRTLDAVFREMINRGVLDDVELGEEQIAKINNIIRDSGFETACALCFVDSKRYRQAMVADNFVNMYNELVEMLIPEGSDIQAHHFDFLKRGLKGGGRALHDVPDSELGKGIVKLKKVMQEEPSNRTVRYKTASHLLHNPKDRRLVMRSEFMNTDGFEAVTVANRKVLGLYNSSKGSGGPKASLSDVQYLGDILKKSNFTPARAYAVGGVRIQSFSDYVPRLVFDYLQMMADLAAKKLPAHAYTKEEMFALQFGMTGVKINLSLVPAVDPKGVAPGLDADGNYVWYDGQSFGSDVTVKGSGQTGFQRAVEIQNAAGYSANCGTIAVGISDEHIWKMLDDDDIRMVIPYHKSSLNHIVAVLNNIDKYTDYTGVQNTRYKATGSKIDGKDFNFNEALRRLGDAKAAANEYLEWCEKNGYLPKFDTFAEHENYYKLLEDFSTYDNGVAAPQGAVTMTFPKEGDAFGSMAQLIEQGLEEDAVLEGRRQSDVPGIVDKIEAVYREGGMEKGAQFSLKEQGDLMRENAKLKEVNQALQEQLQVTKFAKVDKKSLDRFAKQLLKDYSSDADMDDVRGSLDSLYTYLANGEDGQTPAWEQAYRMAYETAQSVLENASEVNDELYQQYKGLRNRLRNTAIRLDRSYEHDMGGYENLEEFRKANFGRIKLSKDGIPVDTLYQELAATYPELFDESEHNHPGDQLAHIAEVLADLQPYEWNPYGRNMREAATWLANDIMERFFELPQAKPTFADKAERKLTEQAIKDAKKLESLRTKKNERIAQLIQEGREKVKTAQAKERTKRQEAVKEVKEHYKAKEKKMSESRKASVLRARIERHASELKEKLLRPTDKKHIPQELQGAVAKLLESINMESGYDMVYGKDGKYHRVERGTELGAETTKRTQAFAELQSVYAQLANELTIDPDLMGEDGLLNDVIKLADKPLANMSSSELQTVWEALRGIEATVLTANRMHAEGRWAVVSEAAEALREDNAGKKDKTELRGILGKGQKLVGLDMETPETFFHLLGDAGDAVFRMMRNSQDEHIRLMKEVAGFTKRELKAANVRKLERELHTVTLGGEDVKLTTAQIMELYVLMHREQALDHIFVGGILPDVVSTRGIKKVSKAEPVRGISLEEVSKAVKVLTPEQKAIAEKLQKYASTKLSEYGNAAAMKVYGYEKFGEKNYWPIRSNRQEIKKDVQTDTATVTLANRGFTKGTKPHANNSVRLGSIFDTFSTHASEMATYSAWLGTLEDVNRLRNYKFREDDAVIGTVSGIIDRVHGTQGSDYLAKLLNDVTNGVKGTHGETAYMSGLVGNFKAASVGANLRVIIQQPTAILRAMDMIGAHYLAVPGNPLNGWKKALKYAPIAQWKDWGYFDINTGRQMKDVLFDSDSAVDKVKSISMWGAGAMDSVAWGQLWNAVEAEVKAKRKELKPDTEEFYKAVAERFTEVVDHTQVVDGILQRSQIMRSADGLTKMATAFMGEPTKQYNMMLQAAYDAKNGKGNLRKAAMKKLARTAAALAVAGVVNSMAQSVMDAVRDDDKEEEWWEKWLAAFKSNLGSTFNPVSYIPFAKDVLSILEGYDVSRMDMESVEKLVSAGQNMIKALNGTGKHTVGAAAINLIAEISRMVGIPVSNLKREITSFTMLAAVETDNYVLQYRMEKWLKNLNYSGNSGTFMDILYNAYVNNKEAYELIYNDMLASGYDADKLASGMESRMKKAQGVTKVDEMEQRYLSPSQQTKWDNTLKSMQGSSVWKNANAEQRDGLEDDLYDLITQNSDGKKMQEDISEAAAYGVSESEYLLWQLALDMNNVDGKGGYNTSEKAGALISMTELSDFEKAYLWGTMTTSAEVFDAYDAGVDMDAYFGFKAGVSELEAGVDYKKGDTASRQAAIRMLLDSLGIDSDDRNWLYHTEYKK